MGLMATLLTTQKLLQSIRPNSSGTAISDLNSANRRRYTAKHTRFNKTDEPSDSSLRVCYSLSQTTGCTARSAQGQTRARAGTDRIGHDLHPRASFYAPDNSKGVTRPVARTRKR